MPVRSFDLSLPARGEMVHVVGVYGAAGCQRVRGLLDASTRPVVYVTATAQAARQAADDWRGLDPEIRLGVLPTADFGPYDAVRAERTVVMERLACLSALDRGELDVLVTSASGLLAKVIAPEPLAQASLVLQLGESLDIEALSEHLADAGYQRAPLVEDAGSFAVRGDIVDLWPAGSDSPMRLELEFDALALIRPFDPDSQLSDGATSWKQLLVPPCREALVGPRGRERVRESVMSLCDDAQLPTSQTNRLLGDLLEGRHFAGSDGFLPAFVDLEPLTTRLPESALLVFEGGAQVRDELRIGRERVLAAFDARQGPAFAPEFHVVSATELATAFDQRRALVLHGLGIAGVADNSIDQLATAPQEALRLETSSQERLSRALAEARKTGGQSAGLDPLEERLRAWHEQGLVVYLTARVNTQLDRLRTLLEHRGFAVQQRETSQPLPWPDDRAKADVVRLALSDLTRGFVDPGTGLSVLTEEEVFGQRMHRQRRAPKRLADAVDDLRSLSVGDYVVHVEHGIGKYLGLTHRTVQDTRVELLTVEYAGGDRLYLPVYRLNQIQRFSSGDKAPRVDRLGGQSFAKTKGRVRKRVREIADQLLRLYAERRALGRPPVEPPGDDYAAFEASFPYEETPDQAAAIADVIDDLTSDTVMDRLVCGDVGFGKTEVALRATFLNLLSGRQVAVLCPTTVLAEQHFNTFVDRLQSAGAEIRALSRFQSKKQVDKTLADLKSGRVDVVIGTHRLLSADVHFKNLGLLVVDEEQRFGVTHKERIKELRKNVDVLTLTATPIPRTLGLAVSGLRDMSVINTPPVDRRTIRTFVSQFDEQLVTQAIERELERGGQVFYVYNRVEGIYERSELLRRLMPKLRLGVAHGQMPERALEKTMLGFVDGDFDVLVATAIIESGLDIPRANTIIVDRADLFGLSQLYQIRGRVGRARERAYCYLLLPPEARLSDDARRRIEALERHTELGSGFHIANLDMELRGTGEVLGAEQSGFVARVGLELFSEMLEQATQELAGETWTPEVDPDLSVDAEALIPEDYIEDVGVRLSLYKRLARAHDDQEISQLSAEMSDRFGQPPEAARRLVELMRQKTELRRLCALGLRATAKHAAIDFRQDTPVSASKLAKLVAQDPARYSLSPSGQLARRARPGESFPSGLEHSARLLEELEHTR